MIKIGVKSLESRVKVKKEQGQILLLVMIALGVVLFTVLFVIGGALLYFQNAQYAVMSEKASALAEAGIDKALASLNKTGGSYNGEQETILGDGSYSVEIIAKDTATKLIQATGYIPNKTNPKSKKTITMQVSKGVGISFNYGLQIGEGGLEMGNSSTLNGSIYSNGSILGGNGNTITGDVYVAGGGQVMADQQSDCFGANCQDYVFGKNVGGEDRQDVAQSFKPASQGSLNKVKIKLKKIGSPANPTVRIMTDAGGKPNKNGVLGTGILSANLVTTEYSYAEVTFDTAPALNQGQTYWIMVHSASLDSSKYWIWSLDLAQGYTQGSPKWSSRWDVGNPTWSSILGDLGFETYMGGVTTSIDLASGSQINGNVHANTLSGNMTILKDAYYQNLGPSVIIQGAKFPGSEDPAPAVFPISDANILDWKNQAADEGTGGGVTYGDINGCTMALGPRKIVGNLILGNTCTVTVKSPLWITGNITTGNSTQFVLDPSYGTSSGVIIVDGTTIFGNGVNLRGSGETGSYLMLLSNFDSTLNGTDAITAGNSSISGIIYAPKGKVTLPNGASFKELSAWKIIFGNSTVLSYETGLASVFFSTGQATGGFSLIKGTYQVK